MNGTATRDLRRRETCARKIDYPTWDAAEQASLQIIRDGISPDANGPAPYPCPFGDHYHVGHLRFSSRERDSAAREQETRCLDTGPRGSGAALSPSLAP